MRIPTHLIALPFLLLPWAKSFAAEQCDALQAEVTALRAKVLALETSLKLSTPAPTTTALPGAATKPAAVATVVIEEPYSKTGCSQGLFKPKVEAMWESPDVWFSLEKGQSPAAVEKLLGAEHYDVQGGGNVIWQYGKCGKRSAAQVLFTKGRLTEWRAPDSAQ